jgi:hypothetical protein
MKSRTRTARSSDRRRPVQVSTSKMSAIVTPTQRGYMRPRGQADPS